MPSRIQTDFLTGKNLYFQVRNDAGQIWNGSAFETYSSSNIATYSITATEQGSSGYYSAAMPSVTADMYNIIAKERAGGSVAETDFTVASGTVIWDGSAVLSISTIASGVLKHDFSSVTGESARSLINALRKLMNKISLTANVNQLTVFKEDDSTEAYRQNVSSDSAAVPIVALDTTS